MLSKPWRTICMNKPNVLINNQIIYQPSLQYAKGKNAMIVQLEFTSKNKTQD